MQIFTFGRNLISCVFGLMLVATAQAEPSGESCPVNDGLIILESNPSRHTLFLSDAQQNLEICNLEVGKQYQITLSALEQHPNCVFGISLKKEMKPSYDVYDHPVIEFTAGDSCMSFTIQNANCITDSEYVVDASVSCKDCEPTLAETMRMMGIMTDPNYSATELIEDVFIGGGCFEISNVQAIGNAAGIGYFSGGATSIGIDEGVILASGNIGNAEGPNTTTSITTDFFDSSGDPDLDIMAAGQVYDAVGIQFDFTPTVPFVQFNYVFGSDEYCDYVNTQFNDVFGFFISGPGIGGIFTNNGDNIATVPGTGQWVNINNINIQTNAQYYVDNVPLGQFQQGPFPCIQDLAQQGAAVNDCEYDGFTTILTASAQVEVCETYTIRLVIGDVGDGIFDSGVFLEANSFNLGGEASISVDLPGLDATGGIAYEGCGDGGYLIFSRPDDGDISQDLVVDFFISPASTATNGEDFTSLPPTVTIPAGQTQVMIPFEVFSDLIDEGLEILILELTNPCTCEESTVEIQIQDMPPLDVALEDQEFCDETTTTLTASPVGGVPGYTYFWSTGGFTPTITVNPTTGTNTYTVTVTDECGNTAVSTSTIIVGEEAFASIYGFVEVCPDDPQGFLEISFTGEGPWDVTIFIDGIPQPPITITENPYQLPVNQTGIYTIGSVMVNGCPGIGDGSGIVTEAIILLFLTPEDVSCAGLFDGSADLTVAGGTPEYTYQWSNDTYNEDAENLGPGIYTVTVTDANGCTQEDFVEIFAPDELFADVFEIEGISCYNPGGGSVDLTVGGGTPEYTYEWDNGSTEEDPMDLDAGLHTVTITDSHGCTEEAEVEISEDTEAPEAEAEVDGTLDCNNQLVSVDGGNSSGSGTLDFEWFDPNDFPIGFDEDIDVADPGTYTLVVTNLDNGCTDETTVVVEQNIEEPVIDIAEDGPLTCVQNEVLIDAGGSNGNGTLSFTWINANGDEIGNGQTLTTDTAGTFILILTDEGNGCVSEQEVIIDENVEDPQAEADVDDILTCSTGMVNLDGSGSTGGGNLLYEWLDDTNTEIGNEQTVDVQNPGTYTLIVTDETNGCTAETTVEVEQDIEDPEAQAEVDGVLTCDNLSVMLDGSGSTGNGTLTFAWLDANDVVIDTVENIDVSVSGTYTLLITDTDNGCTAETELTVDENTVDPEPEASASGILTCDVEEVTLDGSGSTGNGTLAFQWLDANDVVIDTTQNIDVNLTGTYTLVITDTENGCTAETQVMVDEDIEEPIANAGEDGILDCNETTYLLDGTASSTGANIGYEWLDQTNTNVGDEITLNISNPGTYTLIVSNTQNGCTTTDEVTIEADLGAPEPEATVDGILTCDNLEAILDGSGSTAPGTMAFQWLDENDTEIATTPSTNISTPGVYTLLVTNIDNGCVSQIEIEVEQNIADPVANAETPEVLTCAETTVQLDGGSSTGNGTLAYEWQDVGGNILGTNATLDVIDPNTYVLIVTDTENGCTDQLEVPVAQDIEEPVPVAEALGILTCAELSVTLDGSASSGNSNLQYEWLDWNNNVINDTPSFDVENTGTYTLIVTNEENGCSAQTTVEVEEDVAQPDAMAEVDDVLDCITASVLLNGNNSNGVHDLNYEWFDNNGNSLGTDPDQQVNLSGNYILIVTDQVNGCTSETQITVDEDYNAPVPEATVSDILTCELLTVTLDGNGSAGAGNLTYSWLDENDSEIGIGATLDVDLTGVYTLVITDDSNGCTASIPVEVEEDITPPIADAGPQNTLTCDITNVILDGSNSSSGPNISYEWLNPGNVTVSTDITANVGEIGEYTLIVTNTDNGCTSASSVEVVPDANLPIANAGNADLLTCNVMEVALSGSLSSTGNNYSYEWLDPSGSTVSNELDIMVDAPGTYTIIVTDSDNGCTSSASVEVEQNIQAPLPDPGSSPTLTCDETTGILDASNSTSPYGDLSYEWLGLNDESIGNLPTVEVDEAGIYTVIVTAENGCTASAEVEVFLDANVPIADAGEEGTLTCDITVLTIGGTTTSSGPDISYQWYNSNNELVGTDPTLDVDTPDTYTLEVTNAVNNCVTIAQVLIDQNTQFPEADAGVEAILTCDITEILLGGQGTSTGAEFSYEWLNNTSQIIGNDAEISVEDPGEYTLIVTNMDNGCSSSSEVNIDQDIITPQSDAGPGGVLTCDITEIGLDGTNSSGANLSFEWYNPSGVSIANAPQIMVEETGEYTLIVTNTFNGCTSASTVEVIPDDNIPTAIAGGGGVLTCDILEVTIDASASSSVSGNLELEWLNPLDQSLGNNALQQVSTPGVYTIIVTDTENGCSTSALIEVPQDIAPPIADAGQTDTLTCAITDLILTGSGSNADNMIFAWLDDLGNPLSQNQDVQVNSPGVYTLVVTNTDNGCSALADVEVVPDINAPLAVAGPGGTLTCDIEFLELNGMGSEQGAHISYEWLDFNQNTISNNLQTTVSQPGIYTIMVTNNLNGCETQDQVEVLQNIEAPNSDIIPIGPNQLDCNTGSIILDGEGSTPGGNVSFSWSTANGNIISPDLNASTVEVDQAGIYILVVTNLTNGCTDTETHLVDDNFEQPIATISPPELLNCYTAQIQLFATNLSGSGNFGFQWSSVPAGGVTDGDDTLTPTIIQAGEYTLLITNLDNGCTNTATVTVEEDFDEPDAVANVNEELDCIVDEVQVFGEGSSSGSNYLYQWNGPGVIQGQNNLTATVNLSGNYILVVTDINNGCTNEAAVFVDENENRPNAAEFDVVPPPCPGDDASIEILSVTGGEGPYLYSIDGGDNFYEITYFWGLDPGTYPIVIQDAIGCEYEDVIFIPEATPIYILTAVDLDIQLGDSIQLEAQINVPLSALDTLYWAPGESLSCINCLDPFASPLETTTYSVTAINQNGCMARDEITLRVRKDRGIYIPNAFTPFNGDNINDIFHIFSDGKTVKNINKFQIFDRWGELIFEDYNFLPDDPAHGWDGTLRGEPMNPAVFVYWAEIEFIDGYTKLFKGDVTLLR